MRKILIVLSALVISLTLTACTGDQDGRTPPTFTSLRVETVSPVADGELVRFYKAKEEQILVEVRLDNPANLPIKSIVINGYTHNSTKFLPSSTFTVVQFYMDAGRDLAETVYSVDRINYLDGENSLHTTVSSNNEFAIYVYKDAPTVTRENYALTQESITVDFRITDVDTVIQPSTLRAMLYAGETLIAQQTISSGFTTVTFDGLLSNRLYEFKIIADYDLDDGNDLQDEVTLYSGSYSTLANGLPSASVQNVTVTSNAVQFDVAFTDTDDVVVAGGLHVAIYNGDTLVDTIQIAGGTTGLSFDGLLNDNTYDIVVLADYDLSDGLGVREDNMLAIHTFSTLPRQVPLPALLNLDLQENSVEFDVFIDDPLGIIDETSLYARIYVEDVLIDEALLVDYHVDFQVNNLFANHVFRIEILGDYDLNDGAGVQADEILFTQTYNTLDNAVPAVTVASLTVDQGYVTVDVSVSDPNVTLSGTIEAILYEEGIEVDTISFDADTSQLVFAYPTIYDHSYAIEFVADYNLRDNLGLQRDQLLRRVLFYTAEKKAPIAEIHNTETTSGSISFDVHVIDADTTIEDATTFVQLYLDGVFVMQEAIPVGVTFVSFTGLRSNNQYDIRIVTDFDLEDQSGILSEQLLHATAIQTEPKEVPTSETTFLEAGKTDLVFDVDIIDVDGVLVPGSILAELYYEGTLVDSQALVSGENFGVTFTNLFSNSNYRIVYVVDYDLTDGNGVVSGHVVGEDLIRTDAKQPLDADFEFIESDETSITFDVLVSDPDDTLTGDLQAILVLNDTPTGDSIPLALGFNSDLTFDNLYSNQRYYIYITADYDLNDDDVTYDDELLATDFVRTYELDGMSAFLDNIVTGTDAITFDVSILDPSGVITGNLEAVLYQDGIPTGATIPLVVGDNLAKSFTGLNSSTDYRIQIETDYDLNELSGPVLDEILDEADATTETLAAPTATIGEDVVGETTLDYTITVTDDDNTITGNLQAVLYKDDVATGDAFALSSGANSIQFTGLFTGTAYEVRVVADYDLNDGVTVETSALLASVTSVTIARVVPTITITGLSITADEVVFTYTLNDTDNVMTPGTVQAQLIVGGSSVATQAVTTNTVSFDLSNFLADFAFEIHLTGDYDLGDEAGLQNDGLIETLELTTLAYTAPSASISSSSIHQDRIDATIVLTDDDDVTRGNLQAILYDDTNNVLGTIALSVGTNDISFPYTVTEQVTYRIGIEADYNLLDGDGMHTDVILAERIVFTNNKLIPEATVSNPVEAEETFTFDVDVLDDDLTLVGGTIYANLYLDGVYQDQVALVAGSNLAKSFSGLQSNTTYVIRIVADYNNGDGNGLYDNAVIGTSTFTTDEKADATASITTDTLLDDQWILDIVITDASGVTTARSANLYDTDGNLVASVVLNVGANNDVTFNGLTMNTAYDLRIEVTIDKNEGDGAQAATLATETETTATNVAPSATIDSITGGDTTIDVDVTVTDEDDTITGNLLAVLYKDGVEVDSEALVTGANSIQFTGLLTGSAYDVRIVTDYDLNDGNGTVAALQMATSTTNTNTQVAPSATIDGITPATDAIDVTYTITDDDAISSVRTVAIYTEGGTLVASTTVSVGSGTASLTGLDPNTAYDIRILVTYDLGDGSGVVSNALLASQDAATNGLITVDTISNDVSATNKGRHQIDVTVDDVDGILTSSLLTATLYENGVPTATYIVTTGTATTIQMIDLLNDYEYELVISATYDVGAGSVTEDIHTYTFTTEALTEPEVVIDLFENWTLTPNVVFDLTIGDDTNAVMSDTGWVAYLYVDGALQDTVDIDATYGNPENATTTITFSGYAATGNEAYTILITALVDRNDEPGGTAVETPVDSATGINAGN